MTDIGSALLRAILDEPDCDDHRLVYADYLEGEVDTAESRARAEFIRVQMELANLTAGWKPEHLTCLDMYLDPDDAEQQRWKQQGHTWTVATTRHSDRR